MKLFRKRSVFVCLLITLFALSACQSEEGSVEQDDALFSTSGMALTVNTLEDSDVTQIAYTIQAVDCVTGDPAIPEMIQTTTKTLEEMLIPGGSTDLQNAPLDANSGHLFADAFFWLAEGCYDVDVQPLQEDGSASEDCSTASADQVPVFDGQTTEIMVISQCDNNPAGGLDVIAALNNAPQLVDVDYSPSKFTCTGETTICATASDPDNDPLAFVWGIEGAAGASVTGQEETTTEEGEVQSCATFAVETAGDYNVSLTVYDQAWDAEGELIPIETLLEEGLTSRDEAKLPIHSLGEDACYGQCSCPEGFTLNLTGEACERITETAVESTGEFLTVCAGSQNENYGALGAIFPDGATLQSTFFGDGYDTLNGRLYDIGIWACGPDGVQSTTSPEDEWIGFSRCLDIETTASYVIGLSADNIMRAKVNGQLVFELDLPLTESRHPYKYMHMIPVDLQAGVNVIELEGLNYGGPAAFAAELFGPFTTEQVANDASLVGLDYEGNNLWNTGDEIGNTFHTGTNSGYQCPDGFVINLCGEAVCSLIEQALCE